MFKNNDNSISQKIIGNNNTQTLNRIYPTASPRIVDSRIANLLQGISRMVKVVVPSELDVLPFDLLKKVGHNDIQVYKDHFDIYMENKGLIEAKLNILAEYEPLSREQIIQYVRNKWITLRSSLLPDERIENLVERIRQDLLDHSTLELEDIAHIPHIVFFVFSECKIFDKPPC